jgi:5'-nucleotidase
MRIMVTNDDGIDSIGLHVLARAMREHGDVFIVAPDSEYSGAGAALGPVHLIRPDVHKRQIDGIDESWSVEGPPGLCAMFARMEAFGPIDLVVSGINPGANVGRSVYHSGTIGAALTARNGGVSGIAVSQSVDFFGIEGQAWEELIEDQLWESAAQVASQAVGDLIAHPPEEPYVLNLNVPNLPIDEIKGWRYTDVALLPPRTVGSVTLVPRPGHQDAFSAEMTWGDSIELPADTDSGAIMQNYVTVSWLSRLTHVPTPHAQMETGLDGLFT